MADFIIYNVIFWVDLVSVIGMVLITGSNNDDDDNSYNGNENNETTIVFK